MGCCASEGGDKKAKAKSLTSRSLCSAPLSILHTSNYAWHIVGAQQMSAKQIQLRRQVLHT